MIQISGKGAVFEVKYSDSIERLPVDCSEALLQIDDRIYAKEFEDDYSQVVCYGISFYKKRCLVLKKEKSTKAVTVHTVLCTCCTTSGQYSDGAGIRLLADRRLSNEPDALQFAAG